MKIRLIGPQLLVKREPRYANASELIAMVELDRQRGQAPPEHAWGRVTHVGSECPGVQPGDRVHYACLGALDVEWLGEKLERIEFHTVNAVDAP